MLHATELVKQNIRALLKVREAKARDLAFACGKSESWLSQILRDPTRRLPSIHFDKIADFFGIAVYQLFVPGIAVERRSHRDRRTHHERRIGPAARTQARIAAQVNPFRPHPDLRQQVEAVLLNPQELALLQAQRNLSREDLAAFKTQIELGQSPPVTPAAAPPSKKTPPVSKRA